MENFTTIYLHQVTCFFADISSRDHNYCLSPDPITNTSTCYHCLWVSQYFFDGDGDLENNISCNLDDSCVGSILTKILVYLIILTGVIGAVTNVLIILVLRNGSQICGPSLTALLIPLAICDFLTCFFSTGLGISLAIIFNNVSRGKLALRTMLIVMTSGFICRTMSMFIAVVITAERYFVVADPLKFKNSFTLRKTQKLCAGVCLFAVVFNLPRWFDADWEEVGIDVGENETLPYIVGLTDFGYIFYDKLSEVYFIVDFLVPLPTLLVFNYLIYRAIRSSNENRKSLQCPMAQKEVRVTKMFSWVVTVLLVCHIIPIGFHAVVGVYRVMHRDLAVAASVFISLNSAVNFIIYCAFGEQFRVHFFALILSCPGIKQIYELVKGKKDNLCQPENNNNWDFVKKPLSHVSRSISNSSSSSRRTRTSVLSLDGENMMDKQPVVLQGFRHTISFE